MLTYHSTSCGTSETENGSPADSLLSGECEDPNGSPETPRDTEEESDFYAQDSDDDEEQSRKRRTSVSC